MRILTFFPNRISSPKSVLVLVVLMATAIALSGSNAVQAQQTYNWIGSGQETEFFHINSNWLQNQVPGQNDNAHFGISFAIPITIRFEYDHTVDELLILDSEYTFRGFNFHDNTPTVLQADSARMVGDAKLTLQHGVNGRSFEMTADQLLLAAEMNILQGTSGSFADTFVGLSNESTLGLLTVSGEMNGNPSTLNADDLMIADDGLGRVIIEDGAQANVTADTQVSLFGGNGELHITGNDQSTEPTRLTSGNLVVASPSLVSISGRSEVTLNNFATFLNSGEQTVVSVAMPGAKFNVGSVFQIGGGEVRFEDGAQLTTNNARINFSSGGEGSLTISSSVIDAMTSWSNSGNVNLAGGDGFVYDGGRIVIDGGIVEIGQTLTLYETAELSMSESQDVPSILIVDTVDNTDAGQFDLNDGTLTVDWYYGDLDNFGGTLAPGNIVTGDAPGRTAIFGDYVQSPMATLAMDIGGITPIDEYDLLEIGGFMIADGRLQLNMQNGFVPSASDEIVLASAANVIGSFTNVANGSRLTTTDGSGSFQVNYGFASQFASNQIVLSDYQVGGTILGDINGDGSVDLLDVVPFVELLADGGFVAAADINQDGNVDLLDVQPFVDLLTGS